MLCCLLALMAMAGAVLARWRRAIGWAAAIALLTGASAALAWSLQDMAAGDRFVPRVFCHPFPGVLK